MTRLRPKRSATTPAKGAAIATASVEADTTRLIAAAETRNSRASMGNSGCGANSVRKAQNPANTTAAVRVVEWAVAGGSIPFHYARRKATPRHSATNGGADTRGKPWYSHPISSKVRRK